MSPTTTNDMLQATSVAGIFAAGEVATDIAKLQAITAASQGAEAAMEAQQWLAQVRHGITTNRQKQPAVDRPLLKQDLPNMARKQRQELDEDCDLEFKDCLRALVARYPVVVFSKPWCPYCQKALEILTAAGVGSSELIKVVDLTKLDNGSAIQRTLQGLTGRRSVPNVFIGGTSIGGGDETVTLQREGKLNGLLRDAGAIRS
jgi:glutaredoxin 3